MVRPSGSRIATGAKRPGEGRSSYDARKSNSAENFLPLTIFCVSNSRSAYARSPTAPRSPISSSASCSPSIDFTGYRHSPATIPTCFEWPTLFSSSGLRGALRRRDIERSCLRSGERFHGALVGADRFHDRTGCRRHELLLVGRHMRGTAVDRLELTLEMRHHEACDHFIAAPHLFARRPIVREGENGAEPTRQLLELLQLEDRVFRRAENAAAEFIHDFRRGVAVVVDFPVGTSEDSNHVFVVPALEAVRDLAPRLVARIREMKGHYNAPGRTIRPPAAFLSGALGKAPLGLERGESRLRIRCDRENAHPVLAGALHPRGRNHRGNRHRNLTLHRAKMECGIPQPVPGPVKRYRLALGEQAPDDCQALVHLLALRHRIDAEHERIGRQRSGADPKHGATAAQMVEHDDTLGYRERMMVRNRHDPGAEHDALGFHSRSSQEHLRRRDSFPSARMMFLAAAAMKTQRIMLGTGDVRDCVA